MTGTRGCFSRSWPSGTSASARGPRWRRRSFYDNFPGGGHQWVSADGPFNEHLVRDVGTLNLALAAVTIAALVRPGRYLVQVVAGATLVYSAPHFLYHLFHLDLFDTSDKVLQTGSLAITVIAPLLLLIHARPTDRTSAPQPLART